MSTNSKKITNTLTTISTVISIFAGLIAILDFFFSDQKDFDEIKTTENTVRIVKNKSLDKIVSLDITDDLEVNKQNDYCLLSMVVEDFDVFKRPDYKVIIDNKEFLNSTIFNEKIKAGKHDIKVTSDNHINENIEVDFKKNHFYEIKVKLFPDSPGGYFQRKLHIWKNQNNSIFWKTISIITIPMFYGVIYLWFFILNNFEKKYYVNFKKLALDKDIIKKSFLLFFMISCFLSFISFGLFDYLAMATSINISLIIFFLAPVVLVISMFLFYYREN